MCQKCQNQLSGKSAGAKNPQTADHIWSLKVAQILSYIVRQVLSSNIVQYSYSSIICFLLEFQYSVMFMQPLWNYNKFQTRLI